jgi:outer membrane protein
MMAAAHGGVSTPGWRRRRQLGAVLGLFLASLALCTPTFAQGARVGYVDMKRLIDSAPQLRAGRELLEREFADRDSALRAEQQRLADLEARQRREAGVLDAATAEDRAREIDALRRNLERTRTRLREDLNRRAQEEYKRRWDTMQDQVTAFARENGYDLIVESPVVYASPAIDVTDAILERLRREESRAPAP